MVKIVLIGGTTTERDRVIYTLLDNGYAVSEEYVDNADDEYSANLVTVTLDNEA